MLLGLKRRSTLVSKRRVDKYTVLRNESGTRTSARTDTWDSCRETETSDTYVTGAPLRTGGRHVLPWLCCGCIVLLATVVGNRSGPFVSSVQRRGEPEPIYSLKGPNEGQAG